MVVRHLGEGEDDVGAEGWIYILGEELPDPIPVLRPVRVVTHTFIRHTCNHVVISFKDVFRISVGHRLDFHEAML